MDIEVATAALEAAASSVLNAPVAVRFERTRAGWRCYFNGQLLEEGAAAHASFEAMVGHARALLREDAVRARDVLAARLAAIDEFLAAEASAEAGPQGGAK